MSSTISRRVSERTFAIGTSNGGSPKGRAIWRCVTSATLPWSTATTSPTLPIFLFPTYARTPINWVRNRVSSTEFLTTPFTDHLHLAERLKKLENQNPDKQHQVPPKQSQTDSDEPRRLQMRSCVLPVDCLDGLNGGLEKCHDHGLPLSRSLQNIGEERADPVQR